MGNREALLEGAIRCIKEKGYAKTTARDLVATSGTNLGAIGYHFGSTQALLNEALAESFRRWFVRLADVLVEPGGGTATHVGQRLVEGLFSAFDAERPVLVGFFEALTQAERSPELHQQIANHYQEFRLALTSAIDASTPGARSLTGRQKAALASFVMAAVDGLSIQFLLDREELPDPADLVRSLLTIGATLQGRPRAVTRGRQRDQTSTGPPSG